MLRIAAALTGLLLASSGCSRAAHPATTGATTATTAPPTCGAVSFHPAAYRHVIWIWMENHVYGDVIGSPDAPYETGLAAACGSATRWSTVGSPSLPNYIAATSGATQGITDDQDPAAHPLGADNLFRQVRAARGGAVSYLESMPSACQLDGSGGYAVKHNPAAYYVGGGDRAACRTDDVPLGTPQAGALHDAVATDHLPTFSFVTPDLCHDTHDCGVSAGDTWLSGWVSQLVTSAAYRSGGMAIFVVWDESTPVPNIVISPSTRPGTQMSEPVDHYALLRTTEELLGVPLLGAATTAASLRRAFNL